MTIAERAHDAAENSPFLWAPVIGIGISQIFAWGALYYPVTVTGPLIAHDLGLSIDTIYGGYSALLVASALIAPAVGRAIDRNGGRGVLAAGSVLAAAGLAAAACVQGPIGFAVVSVILGIAAAMTLYDAAFPALVESTRPHGRRAITIVTFAGGFASTLSWPATAALCDAVGWRWTYAVYAAAMIAICLPIHLLVLAPRRAKPADIRSHLPPPDRPLPASGELQGPDRTWAFFLLASAISANQFAASGFLIHMIGFLEQMGLSSREAILGSMLFGPSQVCGRVGEMLFGARFSAMVTGRVAAVSLPLGLCLFLSGHATLASAALFVLLLGLSNGLMTIARGTVALALFGPVGYGATVGRMSVPSTLARAAGPLAFAVSVTAWGVQTTVWLGLAAALAGFAAMESVACIERRSKQA